VVVRILPSWLALFLQRGLLLAAASCRYSCLLPLLLLACLRYVMWGETAPANAHCPLSEKIERG
jgi:hypothetical protein